MLNRQTSLSNIFPDRIRDYKKTALPHPSTQSFGTVNHRDYRLCHEFLIFGTDCAKTDTYGSFCHSDKNSSGGFDMFSWALTFLVIGLIAAVLGFTGVAGTATNIAWILFVVGIILAIVFAVAGRRPRL